MNSYDWISVMDFEDPTAYQYAEVSFKNGARKEFLLNDSSSRSITGDMVLVEAQGGYDIGRITLSGELVRLQMKKKNTTEDKVIYKIIRKANDRDLERLEELRSQEKEGLVKARVISRTMGIDMKMGDVEYRGDGKKATFYYTANGRIDFRELVRSFAKEFRVKIEMRQIGSRQESARIGGIGACGRELCCSTWLSDFKSVNTNAARYQNISINQTKLSGQCGRLKCCLNYELDTYLDALEDFPEKPEVLHTKKGNANLIKMDIFKGILIYSYENPKFRGQIISLSKEKVKEVKALNAKKMLPDELIDISLESEALANKEEEIDMFDQFEEIVLPSEKKKKRRPNNRNKKRTNRGPKPDNANPENRQKQGNRPEKKQHKPRTKENQTDANKSVSNTNEPQKKTPNADENKPNPRNKKRRYFKNKKNKPNNQ
jgi:cell fate regulator YaaT (PSP1 superfamily)